MTRLDPRPVAALLCTLAIAMASAASATQAPPPDELAPAARQQLERIAALQQQRPGDALLVYYEALVLAQAGQAQRTAQALARLAGRGSGIVPVRAMGFGPVWDDAQVQAAVRRLDAEAPATPAAPVVRRLADRTLVPEGIAYDARRRVHYLGSIAQRKVVAVDARGRTRDISRPADALDAVLGLALDAQRDRLCAVSTNGFTTPAEVAKRNAVVCWNLANGRRVQRTEVPAARQLNDLALAPDGTAYVTDSATGALWRLPPSKGAAPHALVAAGTLAGANGVARAADGTLYVALNTGIARVEAATGAVARLAQPDELVSGGIDGLVWHEGDLFGVQNVPSPGRVVRLHLGQGGTRIERLTLLQDHRHPAFATPTTGAIAGDRLHVIANSHVKHVDEAGRLRDVGGLRPPAIVAVPLSAAGS
jgi:sugar lactone lactonase YvrE